MRDRAVRNCEAEWADSMRAAIADDRRAYERLLRELACVLRLQVCRALLRGGQAWNSIRRTSCRKYCWPCISSGTPGGRISGLVAVGAGDRALQDRRRDAAAGLARARSDRRLCGFASSEEPQPQAAVHDIARQLDRLPAGQREVVRSISIAGASIAETAARLDMTQGAVRVALHRGLTALAKAQER